MYILQKEKNILKKQSMVLLKLKHWKATKKKLTIEFIIDTLLQINMTVFVLLLTITIFKFYYFIYHEGVAVKYISVKGYIRQKGNFVSKCEFVISTFGTVNLWRITSIPRANWMWLYKSILWSFQVWELQNNAEEKGNDK